MDIKNSKIMQSLFRIKTDYFQLFYDSYITIRKTIGILSMSLPVLLIIGGLILNGGKLEQSLSAYYHNSLGDIFVLILGASGLLLMVYRGREKIVRALTSLGGVLALLIVIFPTKVPAAVAKSYGVEGLYGVFKMAPDTSRILHTIFAVAFFILLGFISIWRFTDHAEGASEERKSKDRWYRLLGSTIVVCGVISLVISFFPGAFKFYPVIIVETIGLEAMGLTWLIKGARKIGKKN